MVGSVMPPSLILIAGISSVLCSFIARVLIMFTINLDSSHVFVERTQLVLIDCGYELGVAP